MGVLNILKVYILPSNSLRMIFYPFSGFLEVFKAITCLPLYLPQVGQTVCESILEWHWGHSTIDGRDKARWLRLSPLLALGYFLLGRGVIHTPVMTFCGNSLMIKIAAEPSGCQRDSCHTGTNLHSDSFHRLDKGPRNLPGIKASSAYLSISILLQLL